MNRLLNTTVPVLAQNQKTATEVKADAAPVLKTAVVAVDNPQIQTLPVQAAATVTEKSASVSREFFGPEKSKADTEPMKKENDVTAQDAPEAENTTYLKKTVDGGKSQFSGDPYDFSFKNADISNLLKFIAKISGLNMVIDPDVTGRFTCELIQVPWDQALELILKVNGLDMIQEGNILRIGKVDKLAQESKQRQALREARLEEGNLEVSTRTLSYARASELMPILKKQMSPRGELLVDERTNTLIISEVPEKIKIIDSLIDTLDAANPQVSIEARIVEATTNSLDTFGIQWGYNLASPMPPTATRPTCVFPTPSSAAGYGTCDPRKPTPIGYAINLPTARQRDFPENSPGQYRQHLQPGRGLERSDLKGQGQNHLLAPGHHAEQHAGRNHPGRENSHPDHPEQHHHHPVHQCRPGIKSHAADHGPGLGDHADRHQK